MLHCATWGKHPVPVAGPCHRNKMLRVVSVSAFVNVKGHWRAFHREKRRLLSDSLTAHRGFCGRFKRRLSDTSGKETKCHSHSTRFSSTAKWLATSAFSSLILNALGIKKGKALTQESLEVKTGSAPICWVSAGPGAQAGEGWAPRCWEGFGPTWCSGGGGGQGHGLRFSLQRRAPSWGHSEAGAGSMHSSPTLWGGLGVFRSQLGQPSPHSLPCGHRPLSGARCALSRLQLIQLNKRGL